MKHKDVANRSSVGDVWYFPPGVPHSIQAFDQGAELLLVFDDVGLLTDLHSLFAILNCVYGMLSVLTKDIPFSVSLGDLTTSRFITDFPFNVSLISLLGPIAVASATSNSVISRRQTSYIE